MPLNGCENIRIVTLIRISFDSCTFWGLGQGKAPAHPSAPPGSRFVTSGGPRLVSFHSQVPWGAFSTSPHPEPLPYKIVRHFWSLNITRYIQSILKEEANQKMAKWMFIKIKKKTRQINYASCLFYIEYSKVIGSFYMWQFCQSWQDYVFLFVLFCF